MTDLALRPGSSTFGESPFFDRLLDEYPNAVSIAVCRVPELELLSRVPLIAPVLDHCCGDGRVAALAFPGRRIDAGIDINRTALAQAMKRGNYARLEWADASRRLPFDNASFATVFDNSALEHIPDIDSAVSEIARVLRPGGFAYINVLNERYFSRWPLDPSTLVAYREFQPFHHALDESGWTDIFCRHGFIAPSFESYFDERASRVFAELDYRYSAFYIEHRLSLRPLLDRLTPRATLKRRCHRLYDDLCWDARPGQGSGFLISAQRA